MLPQAGARRHSHLDGRPRQARAATHRRSRRRLARGLSHRRGSRGGLARAAGGVCRPEAALRGSDHHAPRRPRPSHEPGRCGSAGASGHAGRDRGGPPAIQGARGEPRPHGAELPRDRPHDPHLRGLCSRDQTSRVTSAVDEFRLAPSLLRSARPPLALAPLYPRHPPAPGRRVTMPTMLWRRLDQPGHDSARLVFHDAQLHLSGTAVFVESQQPCRLDYRVVCDTSWRTMAAWVAGWLGNRAIGIELRADEARRWWLNDVDCSAVAGCLDLDLSFTPATNLLPIRRLALAIGEKATVRA